MKGNLPAKKDKKNKVTLEGREADLFRELLVKEHASIEADRLERHTSEKSGYEEYLEHQLKKKFS